MLKIVCLKLATILCNEASQLRRIGHCPTTRAMLCLLAFAGSSEEGKTWRFVPFFLYGKSGGQEGGFYFCCDRADVAGQSLIYASEKWCDYVAD